VEIGQRVAVVTGGASGIGRSLCLALAAGGAAAVVVADIDGEGAAKVAADLEAAGHKALAVTTDLALTAGAEDLVAQAQAAFGRIDLLFSNAGIIVGGGVELSDEVWSRTWAVNVHSHIALARAVLPQWLARGEGYLVCTASAAGLLTQLGSAPYAVTKHAVVALAEWLSITYGDQGIRVSCLCPQAVSTNLGATSRLQVGADTPATWSDQGGAPQAAVDGVLTPDQVAAVVMEGVADERFLILPHPEVATYERRRAGDRERWLRGMRRMAARLRGGPGPAAPPPDGPAAATKPPG
jgi:NAD(P)-dependent dehydrogenase (short-subunit alcohol dehydrogenase family)